MEILDRIIREAKNNYRRIVLPEGDEPRTLKAAELIHQQRIARVILLGDPEVISRNADSEGVDIKGVEIVDPRTDMHRDAYAELMVDIRRSKGLTKAEALEMLNDPLVFAPLMIKSGDADGEVAGAVNATGDVLRPAFQFIKTLPGVHVVSGAFLMFLDQSQYGDNGVLVFADCAVMPDPDDRELAEIAVMSAQTARTLAGIDPCVAMLSFSTKGSARHERVDKVISATRIAREMAPDLKIDGEMQLDAALVPSVGKLKAPGSAVAGKANVLVFPGLEAANIGYKLVQRLANAKAIGPVLQGMAAPINDLSRGCSVSDIVNLIAITSNQVVGSFDKNSAYGK
jgi:phosphate acetyltransferase